MKKAVSQLQKIRIVFALARIYVASTCELKTGGVNVHVCTQIKSRNSEDEQTWRHETRDVTGTRRTQNTRKALGGGTPTRKATGTPGTR